jgi:hypothetical protein
MNGIKNSSLEMDMGGFSCSFIQSQDCLRNLEADLASVAIK